MQSGILALCDWASYNPHVANAAFSSNHATWVYDGVTETLKSPTDWGNYFPYVEHTSKWAEVYVDSHMHQDATPTDNINAKFRIEYCWKNF